MRQTVGITSCFYLIAQIGIHLVMRVIDGSTVESAQSIRVLWNFHDALMIAVYLAFDNYGKEF